MLIYFCIILKSSLVKMAICLYALNDFAQAHATLEEALELAQRNIKSLEDFVQMAEILNNLGCLAYMCGEPLAANTFFQNSMDVQFRALSENLYENIGYMGQSVSLSMSITRANIGFVNLVLKEFSVSVTALENALVVSPEGFIVPMLTPYYLICCFFIIPGAAKSFEGSQ